jgi:hypothetical protein
MSGRKEDADYGCIQLTNESCLVAKVVLDGCGGEANFRHLSETNLWLGAVAADHARAARDRARKLSLAGLAGLALVALAGLWDTGAAINLAGARVELGRRAYDVSVARVRGPRHQ